jgi:transcription initiation factor IIE alpha subunit
VHKPELDCCVFLSNSSASIFLESKNLETARNKKLQLHVQMPPPEILIELERHVARAFYEPRVALAYEAVLDQEIVDLQELSWKYNISDRDLRKFLAPPFGHELVRRREFTQARNGTAPCSYDYYYVDHALALDQIRFRVRSIIAEREDAVTAERERPNMFRCETSDCDFTVPEHSMMRYMRGFKLECPECDNGSELVPVDDANQLEVAVKRRDETKLALADICSRLDTIDRLQTNGTGLELVLPDFDEEQLLKRAEAAMRERNNTRARENDARGLGGGNPDAAGNPRGWGKGGARSLFFLLFFFTFFFFFSSSDTHIHILPGSTSRQSPGPRRCRR